MTMFYSTLLLDIERKANDINTYNIIALSSWAEMEIVMLLPDAWPKKLWEARHKLPRMPFHLEN